jgi:hypothetical protein
VRLKKRTLFADRQTESSPPSLVIVTFVTEDTLMFGGTPWLLPGPATEADPAVPWWDRPPADTLFARAADEGEEADGEEEDDEDDEDDEDEDDEDDEDDDEDDEDDEEEDEDDEDDDEEEDAAPARMTSRPLPLQRKIPQPAGGALRAAVSAEDMRKLESALRELAECRRLLDAAIKEKV